MCRSWLALLACVLSYYILFFSETNSTSSCLSMLFLFHWFSLYSFLYFSAVLVMGVSAAPGTGHVSMWEMGDIEDYPGLDNLASYSVRVEGEDVIIKANKQVQDADTKLEIINN